MELLFVYVFVALGFSFLCSVLEAALLSITPSFIAALKQEGRPLGERLRQLKDDVDRPLAAILSLNTVAHTVGAAGAGAEAVKVFGDAYIGIISGVLTLLILVISEIIPKTLGAVYWRQLTPMLPAVLLPLIVVTWPLVKLSQGLTRLFSRGAGESGVRREEISALADLAVESGAITHGESRIVRSLTLFSSLQARDVMTPRPVVFSLAEDRTLADVTEGGATLRFSRIPVYADNPDEITGYVLKDHILQKLAEGEGAVTLGDLRRDIPAVLETFPLPALFETLVEGREAIAVIVEERGTMVGIATVEDVVETLLGMEIVDEGDHVPDMQEHAREQWRIRARRMGTLLEDGTETPENDGR